MRLPEQSGVQIPHPVQLCVQVTDYVEGMNDEIAGEMVCRVRAITRRILQYLTSQLKEGKASQEQMFTMFLFQ